MRSFWLMMQRMLLPAVVFNLVASDRAAADHPASPVATAVHFSLIADTVLLATEVPVALAMLHFSGDVVPELRQPGTLSYSYSDGVTRVIAIGGDLYNPGSFLTGPLLTLYVAPWGPSLSLDSAEAVDTLGAMLETVIDGATAVAEKNQTGLPSGFTVQQNYPNPFNPVTTIVYSVPERSRILLEVFDMLGRNIRTLVHEVKSGGQYQVEWDGRDGSGAMASSGIYFYRLRAGNVAATRKMVLLK